MMEAILTRLRDFSCKDTAFDGHKQAGAAVLTERSGRRGCGDDYGEEEEEQSCPLDIERSLAWLRRELMEMRSQDQLLIRQLIDLHTGIQELKLQCSAEEEEEGEEELDYNEEEEKDEDTKGWDSGGESDGNSAYSSSGEVGYPARMSLYHRGFPLGRLFCRRSSVP